MRVKFFKYSCVQCMLKDNVRNEASVQNCSSVLYVMMCELHEIIASLQESVYAGNQLL